LLLFEQLYMRVRRKNFYFLRHEIFTFDVWH